MQIFVNTNYDFVKWRFYAVAFSLLFMLVGGALYAVRGVNWGIDFAGGANVVLKFKDTVPLDVLRHQLADASIQQYGKTDDHAHGKLAQSVQTDPRRRERDPLSPRQGARADDAG